MATPTLRSWYGIAFSTSTTQTSIGMGAPTGTDYPQVGDYIVAFHGSDNLSSTTPTATFSVTGAGAVGAWSYVPVVAAANGTAAGATIGTLGWAQVTTAFTSASRVNAAFASGAAIKEIVATAVNGADVASVASLGGSNVSPATLGAANATDLNVVGTVTESNAAPGVTAGTQIAAVGSTGGGASANSWASLVYASGAAVTTTFADGMALGVKFVGTSAPAFSGALTLSGSGSLSLSGAVNGYSSSLGLSGTGALTLAGSAVSASGSLTLGGAGSLGLSGSPSASGSLSLSGSGSLALSGSAGASTTYRMYEAATPPSASAADFQGVSVGVEFTVTQDCSLTEIRWWQAASGAQVDNRTGALYAVGSTTPLATTSPTAPSGSGWQTLTLASPVALTAGTRYKAVVYHPGGGYSATSHYFDASSVDETNGPLTFYSNANSTEGQGTYNYAGAVTYTASSFNATNYWTDVTVATAGGAPESHSGSLTLSGAGSLALSGSPAASGSLTGSGTGSLALSGVPAVSGSLSLSGAGALTLSGSASAAGMGSLTISGTGSLVLSGKPTASGSLVLAGGGTLVLSGKPTASGSLACAGAGSLVLSGAPSASGSLALGGTGTLALSGWVAVTGDLVLGGTGTLTLIGSAVRRDLNVAVYVGERPSRVRVGDRPVPSVGPRRRAVSVKEQHA